MKTKLGALWLRWLVVAGALVAVAHAKTPHHVTNLSPHAHVGKGEFLDSVARQLEGVEGAMMRLRFPDVFAHPDRVAAARAVDLEKVGAVAQRGLEEEEEEEAGLDAGQAIGSLKTACKALTDVVCSDEPKHLSSLTPGTLKPPLQALAHDLSGLYAALLTPALSVEHAQQIGDVWAIERFQDVLHHRSASHPTDPAQLKCECSGQELHASHHPLFARDYYHPPDDVSTLDQQQARAETKAREQGWKAEVYLTCCVKSDDVRAIVEGVVLGSSSHEADPHLSLCSCSKATQASEDARQLPAHAAREEPKTTFDQFANALAAEDQLDPAVVSFAHLADVFHLDASHVATMAAAADPNLPEDASSVRIDLLFLYVLGVDPTSAIPDHSAYVTQAQLAERVFGGDDTLAAGFVRTATAL